jgi:hypothetical protein
LRVKLQDNAFEVLGTVFVVLGTVFVVLGTVFVVLGTVFVSLLSGFHLFESLERGAQSAFDGSACRGRGGGAVEGLSGVVSGRRRRAKGRGGEADRWAKRAWVAGWDRGR